LGNCAYAGIIPQFCHEIFRAIDENSFTSSSIDPIQFQVHLSMLVNIFFVFIVSFLNLIQCLKEIYNENVYDLLTPSKSDKGLKVREHPKKGFYGISLFRF
jgi:kinesin family protein 1